MPAFQASDASSILAARTKVKHPTLGRMFYFGYVRMRLNSAFAEQKEFGEVNEAKMCSHIFVNERRSETKWSDFSLSFSIKRK